MQNSNLASLLRSLPLSIKYIHEKDLILHFMESRTIMEQGIMHDIIS